MVDEEEKPKPSRICREQIVFQSNVSNYSCLNILDILIDLETILILDIIKLDFLLLINEESIKWQS